MDQRHARTRLGYPSRGREAVDASDLCDNHSQPIPAGGLSGSYRGSSHVAEIGPAVVFDG